MSTLPLQYETASLGQVLGKIVSGFKLAVPEKVFFGIPVSYESYQSYPAEVLKISSKF